MLFRSPGPRTGDDRPPGRSGSGPPHRSGRGSGPSGASDRFKRSPRGSGYRPHPPGISPRGGCSCRARGHPVRGPLLPTTCASRPGSSRGLTQSRGSRQRAGLLVFGPPSIPDRMGWRLPPGCPDNGLAFLSGARAPNQPGRVRKRVGVVGPTRATRLSVRMIRPRLRQWLSGRAASRATNASAVRAAEIVLTH